jgi:DNA repair exonuclease SbcCD ATPase subunit
MRADHSSRCPVCGLFVAKNHSHADELSEAIRPVGLVHYAERERLWRDDRNGEAVNMRKRRQVHERCRAAGEELIERTRVDELFSMLRAAL